MRHRGSVILGQLRLALLPLIVVSSVSGCTLFHRTVDHLNHVYENDCGDGTGSCAPVVSLEPPQGYLAEGAEFTGAEITGPAGKSAVDRVVELSKEVGDLRQEIDELRQQVDLARTTIDQQASTIDGASKELQLAMTDYAQMRENLAQWQSELREFEDKYRDELDIQDEAWDDLERQLHAMIRRCESAAQIPSKIERSRSEPVDVPTPLEEIPPSESENESESAALLPLVPPSGVSLMPLEQQGESAGYAEREPELLPVGLEEAP